MQTSKQKKKFASTTSLIFYQHYSNLQVDLPYLHLAYTSGNQVSMVDMEYLFEYNLLGL